MLYQNYLLFLNYSKSHFKLFLKGLLGRKTVNLGFCNCDYSPFPYRQIERERERGRQRETERLIQLASSLSNTTIHGFKLTT